MQLSGVDKGINTYKMFISEFRLRWPEIRSILRPYHYKSMGKYSNAVFPKVRVGTEEYLKIFLYWATLDDPYALQFWPTDLSSGSFEIIWSRIRFFPLTFNRTEAEHREWSQFVYLAKTHRLICHMTRLFQHVISRDLDLRSNSDIESLRSTCRYTFQRLSKRGTRCCLNYATNFPSSKL